MSSTSTIKDSITTVTRTHVSSVDAHADVAQVDAQSGPWMERREIHDGTALTIASWYADSGDGMPFTTLATTGCVTVQDLLDAVHAVRGERWISASDWLALDCLCTWAINHPSRHSG